MSTMTDQKARDLIHLIRNEGKHAADVYELGAVEDVDGNPIGLERKDLGGGRIARVRLTEHQWQELAHHAAHYLPEERRRALIDAKPHLSWAEVARTLINNMDQEHTND